MIATLLSIIIHIVHSTQYFSTVPEYTEVNPGSVALLRCVVSDKAALSQCVWQVNSYYIQNLDKVDQSSIEFFLHYKQTI